MSELFKELCIMTGQLNDLIAETTDESQRKELIEKFNEICEKIEKLAARKFKENDEFYQAAIAKIKDTETVIRAFKNRQQSFLDFLKYLTEIIDHVNRITLGWQLK